MPSYWSNQFFRERQLLQNIFGPTLRSNDSVESINNLFGERCICEVDENLLRILPEDPRRNATLDIFNTGVKTCFFLQWNLWVLEKTTTTTLTSASVLHPSSKSCTCSKLKKFEKKCCRSCLKFNFKSH